MMFHDGYHLAHTGWGSRSPHHPLLVGISNNPDPGGHCERPGFSLQRLKLLERLGVLLGVEFPLDTRARRVADKRIFGRGPDGGGARSSRHALLVNRGLIGDEPMQGV